MKKKFCGKNTMSGDILEALTKDAGLAGNTIGKINITAIYSYVTIHHSQADERTNIYKVEN
ncbi:MAG: hypothetical protein BGO44_11045 [Legionella sp. 39-23]|nr:MAG: hypothetical protein BGO44_11045 [Legionella sp. 39-23]